MSDAAAEEAARLKQKKNKYKKKRKKQMQRREKAKGLQQTNLSIEEKYKDRSKLNPQQRALFERLEAAGLLGGDHEGVCVNVCV